VARNHCPTHSTGGQSSWGPSMGIGHRLPKTRLLSPSTSTFPGSKSGRFAGRTSYTWQFLCTAPALEQTSGTRFMQTPFHSDRNPFFVSNSRAQNDQGGCGGGLGLAGGHRWGLGRGRHKFWQNVCLPQPAPQGPEGWGDTCMESVAWGE